MFRIFMEEKLITILMLTCLALSIFLRIFLGMLYQNMIRETDNMATTGNRLLKQCKLKFTNCYEMSNGVANISVFVDKFISRLALGRLSFETMYHLSGQTMLLSVVLSGVGVCKSIIAGRTLGEILPFYIVSFAGLYLYFSVSAVADIRGKRRVLKVNLVDYLENHLSPRINVTREDMERLYGAGCYENTVRMTRRLESGDGRRKSRRTDARTAGKRRKRTVELMPIGNRLPAAGWAEQNEEENFVSEEVRKDAGQESLWEEEQAQEQKAVGQETAGQEAMAAGQEPLWRRQEAEGAGAENPADNPAAVTEEELEALLREFLTI